MGATDGGECDTEGTVALQGGCGKHPCTPVSSLHGRREVCRFVPPDSSQTKTSPSPHHHDATLNYFMQT